MTLQSDVAFKCGSGCFILLNACCFDSSSLAPLPHLLLYREGGTALLNFILDPKCSSCGIMSAERNLPLRADTHDNGVSVQKEKKKERLDRPHFSLSKNPFFLSLSLNMFSHHVETTARSCSSKHAHSRVSWHLLPSAILVFQAHIISLLHL